MLALQQISRMPSRKKQDSHASHSQSMIPTYDMLNILETWKALPNTIPSAFPALILTKRKRSDDAGTWYCVPCSLRRARHLRTVVLELAAEATLLYEGKVFTHVHAYGESACCDDSDAVRMTNPLGAHGKRQSVPTREQQLNGGSPAPWTGTINIS